MRTAFRFLITFLVAGLGLALAAVLLAPSARAVLESGRSGKTNELKQLEQLSQRSILYKRDGTLLAVLHAEENRSPVALEKVPEHMVDAILGLEDERFWQHGGVDLRSTGRALFTNVQSGEVVQGGSTITQQLVKNALLTPERSVDRKVREAVLAVRLEGQLSKRQILERYLNTVYFGNGAYGVQAATETYFGKDVEKATVAESALLAGLIRNPVGYDPFRKPALARERRDMALDRMVELGHLNAAEARTLKTHALPTVKSDPLPAPNDYFVEEVKQRLLDDPRLGETAQERYNAVFKGGLKIYTTLDPKMQAAAKEKVNAILPNSRQRFTAALVSVDAKSGAVRAMVGGPNFEQAKFNLVTQGSRQPGSSFKPFVLVAALEAGYGPRHSVNGTSPCPVRMGGRKSKPWLPGNYEGSAGGVMSITQATAKSVNCAYVRLGLKVGLNKVVDVAQRMGITTKLEEVPAISLGTEEVHPLDMAAAYATFANDGVRKRPHFVEKVLDRFGKQILKGEDEGEQVISAQNARVATQVMRSVIEGGTAVRARLPGRVAAGKTGTSQNWENAWFVGYTPQLSTAVWMGSPVGNVPMRGVGGVSVTGGSFPARIWGAFMKEAMASFPVETFKAPDPKLIPRGRFIADPPQAKGTIAKCGDTTASTAGLKCPPTTTTTVTATTLPPAPPTTAAPPTTEAPPPSSTTSEPPPSSSTSTSSPPPSSTSTTQSEPRGKDG